MHVGSAKSLRILQQTQPTAKQRVTLKRTLVLSAPLGAKHDTDEPVLLPLCSHHSGGCVYGDIIAQSGAFGIVVDSGVL